GVVGEHKLTLEPLQHVPLMITPLERTAYFRRSNKEEIWGTRLGMFFLFVGFTLAGFGLVRHAQVPEGIHPGEGWWDGGVALAAVAMALAGTLVFAAMRVYNSLVIYK